MWGATLVSGREDGLDVVSIHAPRVGCDHLTSIAEYLQTRFNSRTPCGVRQSRPSLAVKSKVSIHAPRVGCDGGETHRHTRDKGFNSRTPCGVRRTAGWTRSGFLMFQFTHPVWGATNTELWQAVTPCVSIHAPRVGCDLSSAGLASRGRRFNSRTPCGVRPLEDFNKLISIRVSIHAPRVGCDEDKPHDEPAQPQFQFTHPVWGATD